jgi:hypothetical protein
LVWVDNRFNSGAVSVSLSSSKRDVATAVVEQEGALEFKAIKLAEVAEVTPDVVVVAVALVSLMYEFNRGPVSVSLSSSKRDDCAAVGAFECKEFKLADVTPVTVVVVAIKALVMLDKTEMPISFDFPPGFGKRTMLLPDMDDSEEVVAVKAASGRSNDGIARLADALGGERLRVEPLLEDRKFDEDADVDEV